MPSHHSSSTSTPARTPVGSKDHPLQDDPPSSVGSFSHVDPRGPPAPIPSVRVDLRTDIEAEDASEDEVEEGPSSDQDEEFTDEEGSDWDSATGTAEPDPTTMIFLPETACRALTQVKARDGTHVTCVCGKESTDCRKHVKSRTEGMFRNPPGFYVGMSDPARGFPGHGRSGVFYTQVQMDARRARDIEEMTNLVQAQRDELSDGDDEAEDLARDARVQFNLNTQPAAATGPRTAHADTENLRENLRARTGGEPPRSRRPTTDPGERQQQRPPTPKSLSFYGLENRRGERWILTDITEVREYIEDPGISVKKIFSRKRDGDLWELNGRPVKTPMNNPVDIASHRGLRGMRETKKNMARDPDSSTSDSASSLDASDRKQKKKKKKKKARRQARKNRDRDTGTKKKKGRRRRDSPSDSESSSSDDSSDISSSSSDSSSSRHRKKTRRGRRTTRNRGLSRERKEDYGGADPSVGDKSRIHGMKLGGTEIDGAMAPEDLRRKDSAELFTAAADISAIPGMLMSASYQHSYDDAQNTTEMAATLLATAVGGKAHIHDSMWNTVKRHAMGQIRDRASLFTFVKAVTKDHDAAMEKQNGAIEMLMFRRRYTERDVESYLRNGLLPRIINECYQNYFNLLGAVRQLAFDHNIWEGGPAKAMLDFHSARLLQVRRHALSRKMLVLKTYVYLRDAGAKSFYHESMTESLWAKMTQLTLDQGGHDDDASATESSKTPRCAHCRSVSIHKILKLEPYKRTCFFKDLTQTAARKAASEAVALHKDNPSESMKEQCANILARILDV
jgi:hypothetical protein